MRSATTDSFQDSKGFFERQASVLSSRHQTRKHLDQHYVDSVQNRWAIKLICRCSGSVFPRAMIVAFPSLIIVIGLRILIEQLGWQTPELGGSQIWTGYNSALGFLIIFRTQKAYSRWWEGGTLLQQVRGEWYNAASNLIAFCSSDPRKKTEVRNFQHLLVRMISLLYCSALQQVSMCEDDRFEILDTEGMDEASLQYLKMAANRCEVILSWTQRLVVENVESDVLNVAAPLLTRVFQELSRGYVDLNNVKKIREFPFPFPYAQLITLMLLLHWIITPVASALLVENTIWAGVLTFVTIFTFWCINYIAEEIEMPFGDDLNDLPIAHMQKVMNKSLHTLLLRGSQRPPEFTFRTTIHAKKRLSLMSSTKDFGLAVGNLDQAWPSEDICNESQRHIRESQHSVIGSDDMIESIDSAGYEVEPMEQPSLAATSIGSQAVLAHGSPLQSRAGSVEQNGAVQVDKLRRKETVESLHNVSGASSVTPKSHKKRDGRWPVEMKIEEDHESTTVGATADAQKVSSSVQTCDYNDEHLATQKGLYVLTNEPSHGPVPEEPQLLPHDDQTGETSSMSPSSPPGGRKLKEDQTTVEAQLAQERESCISI